MRGDNYPYEDRRVPVGRSGINLGLAIAIAALIGFQRVYETITYNLTLIKPTLVSFLSCAVMFLVFTPIVIFRHGWVGVGYIYRTRSWLYLVFALLEIQGYYMYNFAIINNNIYVHIISATLGIATLILSKFILKTRFKLLHLLGSLVCFIGVFFVCMSESGFKISLGKDETISTVVIYLFFAVLSIPLYSLSYISLEACLRQFSFMELLMFYGFFGMIINALQIIFIDKYQLINNWDGFTSAKVIAFLLTVTCKSFELLIGCFLIMSSNSVYYSHAKTIARVFFALFTKLKIQHLPIMGINWFLIVGVIVYYVGLFFLGIYQMPVTRDRTHLINFFGRPKS